MNRLFVAHKPPFIGSNRYLSQLKRRYGFKKAGFSGTLDPFASGTLIIATGAFTKLLPYLDKTPKCYRATLWLGARSKSDDLENIYAIDTVPALSPHEIEATVNALQGTQRYRPSLYSAKRIDGKRAYDLAREGKSAQLKEIVSEVYESRLLCYNHPFVHFEVTVSEGTYVRSLGQIVAKRLKVPATLSSLHRIREGRFRFEGEKMLDPYDYLTIPDNRYLGKSEDLSLGKVLRADRFEKRVAGIYLVQSEDFCSIVEIDKNGKVHYKLNRLPKGDCDGKL